MLQIAEKVNALLAGRGERLEVEARKVGWIVRVQLGLHVAGRTAPGYGVELTQQTIATIHRLAHERGVLRSPYPGCTACDELLSKG